MRAVVLSGQGKTFCAGADLKNRAATIKGPGDLPQHSRRTRECFHAIRECAKPVVGAINGAALGAGLAIVASCDILLAAADAVVGLPEINVGLLGGGRHGMRLFGHSRLRRMMLTGLRVDGNELYYTYTVDNQAIVVPENIDAIRALTGTVDDGGESIRRTDRAVGVRQDFVRSSVAAR